MCVVRSVCRKTESHNRFILTLRISIAIVGSVVITATNARYKSVARCFKAFLGSDAFLVRSS